MKIKRISSESKLEETILMGMTVSTEFLSKIRPAISEQFFTSSYAQTVCSWILKFFDKNSRVPVSTLEKIFESRKDGMGREDVMVITKLLERMNDIYSSLEDVDEEFFLQTAQPFIEKRELELRIDKAQGLIAQNELKEAREVLETPAQSQVFEDLPVSLTNPDLVDEALFSEEEPLFEFDGALGNIVGPLLKPWVVIFQAPMKRGKTQFLYETGFLAATSGKKVYHVSLEMDKVSSSLRAMRRITGCCNIPGKYIFPTFDCRLNQMGTCESKHRENDIALLDEDGNFPDFSTIHSIESLDYKVCNFCRKEKKYAHIYDPSTWFEIYEKGQITDKVNMKRIKDYERIYGKNIKFVKYPKYSRSIVEIFQDYKLFSMRTGFMADVFIIDYLDITKPTRFHSNSRDNYDEVWKIAAGKADEFNVLLLSGAQGSRASIKKALMEEEDTTEDIRKLAHVDALFSLNQTRMEKRKQIMRVGCLVHRHRDFDINRNAVVLQQISLGQVILDSEEMMVYESDFDQEKKL